MSDSSENCHLEPDSEKRETAPETPRRTRRSLFKLAALGVPFFAAWGKTQNCCRASCEATSETSHPDSACDINCQAACQTACEVACQNVCELACQDMCQVTCECTCELRCQALCEIQCQSWCELGCEHSCEEIWQAGQGQ